MWGNVWLPYMVNVQHFVLETVSDMKECGVTCGSRARLTCSIFWCIDVHRFQIDLLEIWQFTKIVQNSVSMKCHIFMQISVAAHEPCMLHCLLLDCNGTKWTGNALSIPGSSFLTMDFGRNRVLTGCYFFACLVFSAHYVNVFVTDLTVDHVVTHVQGFSSGILMILCKKLCVECEWI